MDLTLQENAAEEMDYDGIKTADIFGQDRSYESDSSVFLRLAAGSSTSSWLLPSPFSWLLIPFKALGPKRDTCLLVICRPALSFGPQCLSGLGRKRATFFACALLRDATAREKLA